MNVFVLCVSFLCEYRCCYPDHLACLNVKRQLIQAAHSISITGGLLRQEEAAHPPHSPCVPPFLISSVMKTSHARTETPPSFSHPPTSLIINGCFHYELPGALNCIQSFSRDRGGGGLWTAWDVSAEKSGWRGYLCGYFKKVSVALFCQSRESSMCTYMIMFCSLQVVLLDVSGHYAKCEN